MVCQLIGSELISDQGCFKNGKKMRKRLDLPAFIFFLVKLLIAVQNLHSNNQEPDFHVLFILV